MKLYLRHLLVCASAIFAAFPADAERSTPLIGPLSFPLGHSDLMEKRAVTTLRPGLIWLHVERGQRAHEPAWALSSPVILTKLQAQQARQCFASVGIAPETTQYRSPGSGIPYEILTGGVFATAEKAREVSSQLTCGLRVINRLGDAGWQAGPWTFDVLTLDPNTYKGSLVVKRGQGLTRTSQLARESNAIAATNAGFFVMTKEDGLPGTAAGISILNGLWQREPTNNRPTLLIHDGTPIKVSILRTPPPLPAIHWDDDQTMQLTGINRTPGVVRNCGGVGPASSPKPQQDVTCPSNDELIAFTTDAVPGSPGTLTAILQADGVLSQKDKLQSPGDLKLVAAGKWKSVLKKRIKSGSRGHIDMRVGDDHATYAVNGGPTLLRSGHPIDEGDREGWEIAHDTPQARATFIHDWYNRRNPRTAVGVDAGGRFYIVTVDGREFDRPEGNNHLGSAGATIDELRSVMASLNVQDAMNLDGGGSTALVINGKLVNRPSDEDGEREVGDALLMIAP